MSRHRSIRAILEGTPAEAGQGLGPHQSPGKLLTSQAIGVLLRNALYAGIVDVSAYRVRAKRGDFEALVWEELFCRAEANLSGRVPSTSPRKRAHPDFPLRGFVRSESCGCGLTGSWPLGSSVNQSGASRRRDRSLISDSARNRQLVAGQEARW